MAYPDNTVTQTVTIGAGASLSGASANYPGLKLVAVITASTWDAAKITFQASWDKGTTFANVYSDAGEYELSSRTGATFGAVAAVNFIGADCLKVRSGTSGAAVNQVDATVVTLVFIPI